MITRKTKKIGALITLIVLVSLFYYLTPLYPATSNLFFSRFYYLPIILGGLWFGIRGGLIVSFSITIIYLPHILLYWKDRPTVFGDRLMEIFLFNLAGIMIGVLVDKERRQKELNQELQTLATLGEAAASLAHEVKNIIIPIRGLLHRIQGAVPPEGKASSLLEIVEKEASRLENLTKGMLSFSRKTPIQKVELEVCSLAKDIQHALVEIFRQKGVALSVHCPGDGLEGSLDSEKIRQVLINLLENALEASPPGKEVTLTAQRDGQNLIIEVKDHGEGIPLENLDRIFIPFFTTKPKGTGLGLAVSRRIVEEHGGELSVQSSSKEGTTFSLKIPLSNK